MYRKSNTENRITVCKIDSQREFAVWLRKLKPELFVNLEGWDGEGDGREVQKGGDIWIPMADSSVGKGSACNAGDTGSIPGSRRSAGERIGYPSSILGLPLWLNW